MELTLAVVISITGVIISILSFSFARKDKTEDKTGKNSYQQGKIDEKLSNIVTKLEKIERKLDTYDNEIEDRIEKALENHIKIYHS